MVYDKVILVTRKTRLEELIERFNTRAQARFYIERNDGDFGTYEQEHETYQAGLHSLQKQIRELVKIQVIEREHLPNFLFQPEYLVVTFGIDGLVVNTAKYLNGQPLIAINPDPANIDGQLLPHALSTALPTIKQALCDRVRIRSVTMAEALLNDEQRLLAFNDLFVGVPNQVSARYRIRIGNQVEFQSSSGIVISTGAGATGWLSSMFNMAQGIMDHCQPHQELKRPRMQWDSDRLFFVVREPFVSKTSSAGLVCGTITNRTPMVIESWMPANGVIFSDGVVDDYLEFNSGTTATIGLARKHTNLVIR